MKGFLHIYDSSDLHNKINDINMGNKYLIILDIKPLYTNIPVKTY